MIYITGDTHGEFNRFSTKNLKKAGLELTENDYIIVCGDFGLCWSKNKTFEYECNLFAQRKYTILWIQGNHDNYDMIAEFPVEEWHGGKVRHIVRDKVILLERGQLFEIEGETFFTFGGASSHDIQDGILEKDDEDFQLKLKNAKKEGLYVRINHESWWKEELPSQEELKEGLNNLERHNYKVDYVISHCCATSIQKNLDNFGVYKSDILTDYFDELEKRMEYKHWYFGHYHRDLDIDEKHSLLNYSIVKLDL